MINLAASVHTFNDKHLFYYNALDTKQMLYIIFSSLVMLISKTSHQESNSTKDSSECYFSDGTYYSNCFYFDSWPHLNELLAQKYDTNASVVYIKPKSPLLLTNEFKVKWSDSTQSHKRLVSWGRHVCVRSARHKSHAMAPDLFWLFWHATHYQSLACRVFHERKASWCERDLVNATEKNTFFNFFRHVAFDTGVRYSDSKPICPYMFKNSNLEALKLFGLTQSHLLRNLWIFATTEANETSINSSIAELYVTSY